MPDLPGSTVLSRQPGDHKEIIKPRTDKLEYRHVALPNGIQAIVVSDSETDKGAAAMDVQVGSFSDPEDIAGLAHFTEHMLFYGSEKYPKEDEYNKFVSEHGGSSNAFTAAEHTNYHFSVNWDHLNEALDRFAQFFLCPLISADGVDREIRAVDSEHSKNINSDAWRNMQLWRHLANPRHPFHKFATGNLQTLGHDPKAAGIDVHAAMKEFYSTHYSANLMRLVVYGRQSLDELEELARTKFTGVMSSGLEATEVAPDVFDDGSAGVLVRVVPQGESNTLEMSWVVPPEYKQYRHCPCHYVSHLLGHEGPGSVFQLLKARQWVTGLSAGESGLSISSRSLFGVRVPFPAVLSDPSSNLDHVELTDEGYMHVHDIAGLIFQYITLLKSPGGVAEEIFDEMQALAEMSFNFRDKQNPMAVATNMAFAMQMYPTSHTLLGMYNVPFEFNEAAIREVLDCMTPQQVRIMWSSKRHAGQVTKSEPIYGTEYEAEPIPKELLEEWATAQPCEELFLPKRNPFVPTNFDIIEAEHAEAPKVVSSDEMHKLWYMPDLLFKTPKAYMYTDLTSPEAYNTPENAVLTRLLVKLLNDYLNPLAYPAELAGLHYSLSNTASGVQLAAYGFNHKLGVLLEKVLEHLVGFHVKDDRFAVRASILGLDLSPRDIPWRYRPRVEPEISPAYEVNASQVCKEQLAREYANMRYEQPYQRAMYDTSVICEARRWHIDEYKVVVADLTAEDLALHFRRLVTRSFAETLVIGNVTCAGAMELMEKVKAAQVAMGTRAIFASQRPESRIVRLPSGMGLLSSQPGPNPDNDNSAVVITFQIEAEDMRKSCLAQLLAQLGKPAAFHQLRTVEQLGYIVFMASQMDSTVMNVRFILQSSSYSAQHMQGRVDAFLPMLEKKLEELDQTEFKKQVEELAKAKLEKPKRLSMEASRYWREIIAGTCVFDRPQREVEVLATLEPQDLRDFFRTYMADASTRKLLSIHVRGNKDPGAPAEGDGKAATAAESNLSVTWGTVSCAKAAEGTSTVPVVQIADPWLFKRSQSLYPSPK